MGLKVFSNKEASMDYEYSFFREFSSNLSALFDEENMDGILLGFPKVPENPNLRPDCVLITNNRLVIIDFKNYEGRMWLSDESVFESTPWRRDDQVIIEGGSYVNPFCQLKSYKNYLEDLIGRNTFGRAGIACLVCFQGNMNVMNKVPGRFQNWFSVTNARLYLNRIKDIISVKGPKYVDIDEIASHFDAEPFRELYPVSLTDFKAVSDANERSLEADRREYEAKQKVLELEKKIDEATAEKRATTRLNHELSEAKEEALKAKKLAEKTKKEFDEKNYQLELETKRAQKAQAEAMKAEHEEKAAQYQVIGEQNKNRSKIIISTILLVCVVLIISVIVGMRIKDTMEENHRLEVEKAQIEEDYKNGRRCIPVERAKDFIDSKNVCVSFRVNYVNYNNYFIYLNNGKGGTFQVIIPQNLSIISADNAKSQYLNKNIEVHGTIVEYDGKAEIKVTELSQIEIK